MEQYQEDPDLSVSDVENSDSGDSVQAKTDMESKLVEFEKKLALLQKKADLDLENAQKHFQQQVEEVTYEKDMLVIQLREMGEAKQKLATEHKIHLEELEREKERTADAHQRKIQDMQEEIRESNILFQKKEGELLDLNKRLQEQLEASKRNYAMLQANTENLNNTIVEQENKEIKNLKSQIRKAEKAHRFERSELQRQIRERENVIGELKKDVDDRTTKITYLRTVNNDLKKTAMNSEQYEEKLATLQDNFETAVEEYVKREYGDKLEKFDHFMRMAHKLIQELNDHRIELGSFIETMQKDYVLNLNKQREAYKEELRKKNDRIKRLRRVADL